MTARAGAAGPGLGFHHLLTAGTGTLACLTRIVNRGRSVANLESQLFVGDSLVAQANGNYAIFKPGQRVAAG